MRRTLNKTRATVAVAAAALAISTSIATAAPADASHRHRTVCTGGPIASGTYRTLTVTGVCWIPDKEKVVVKGDLRIAPGATLNGVAFGPGGLDLSHFNMAVIHVHGNVYVGKGAILGLGCTPAMAMDPELPFPLCSPDHPSDVSIGGSLLAYKPLTMYLDGIRVHGSVKSYGGGPGPSVTQMNPAFNFVFKDMRVKHDLVIVGWSGGWSGAIRDRVGHDLVYAHNSGVDPDSNEIITNTVKHNLVCWGNSPAAQYGDAVMVPGAAPNKVGHRALGQCKDLTKPFV